MKGKSIIPLVAGLCIGGLALKIGIDTVQRAKGDQSATVKVWAARQDIPRGTAITEALLQATPFPAKAAPAGVITEKDKIIGRVPRIAAPAGLPVLESMLLPRGAKSGLWVPPGYRAVAVRVDESSGVDNLLEPGFRVDVVGYFNVRRGGKQETKARTLIENVEVGAVGQRIAAATGEADAKGGGSSNKPARAVTLFVKPEQVPELHLAEQKGKIKLSMRNNDDVAPRSNPAFVTENDVLGSLPDENEKGASTDGAPGGSPLAGLFKMFGRSEPDASVNSAAPVLAAAIPVAPFQPPPWSILVWNGSQSETVVFKSVDSMERAGEEAPAPAALVPSRNTRSPLNRLRAAQAAAADQPAAPPEEEPEPKELTE